MAGKWVGTLGLVAGAAMTTLACSSGPAGLSCGPGTAQAGQQCVPELDSTTPDGSGAAVDAGEASIISDTGTSESVDVWSQPDAPADGSDASPDDPCPGPTSPPLRLDCSGQCPLADGGIACASTSFSMFLCTGNHLPPQDVLTISTSELPETIRTPEGASPACVSQCADAGPAGGLPDGSVLATASLVFAAYDSIITMEVRVAPPWFISVDPAGISGSVNVPACLESLPPYRYTKTGCFVSQGTIFIVWTNDPDPPARNITVRQVASAAQGCM